MNTFTKALFTAAFLFTSSLSFAQQEPINVLFWNNYLHTNPAMTGAVYKHQANLTWNNYAVKNKYSGPDYPQTTSANYALKLDKIHSGIGVSYRYDTPSFTRIHTGLISYAYHIPIKSMFLSIGVSGGIKAMDLYFPDTAGVFRRSAYGPKFTSDFGIALRHEKWNVGASLTQWNGAILRMKDSADYSYKFPAHFWFFADYRFQLGENWSLTPRIQTVLDRIDLVAHIQAIATWKENLWFGAGVRAFVRGGANVRITPMVGYDIKGRFRIGYSAVIAAGNNLLSGYYNTITHEAVLGLMLK